MREIFLTLEKIALVDDDDHGWLTALGKWHAHRGKLRGEWYASMLILVPSHDGKRRRQRLYMHRLICREPDGLHVDHINGDGLDCRRANLRVVPGHINGANKDCYGIPSRAGFRGVTEILCRGGKRYRARISYLDEDIHLGTFGTAEEAARAYDAKATELWGEFARTNFRAQPAPERRVA